MIENVLREIGGIANYGLISICLFLGVFVGMLIWAFRLKRPYLNSMSALPLEEDDETAARDHELNLNPDRSHAESK